MLGVILVLALILFASCGDDDPAGAGATAKPTVVVTTSVLGDVVSNVVGDDVEVVVVIPAGTDPHEFQPSARQAETIEDADVLVTNGLGFEAGLIDVIEAADGAGVPTVPLGDSLEPAGDGDPHWFNDPLRMADAVDLFSERLSEELVGMDVDALRQRAAGYRTEIEAVHSDIERILDVIPQEDRKLVTNHESFGSFAARYGFEYVGAVIPNLSTAAEPSAAELGELAELIEAEGVPAIFGEVSQPTELADALAREVGIDVAVVELFSESLGDDGSGAESYIGMQRTNAQLIADALA